MNATPKDTAPAAAPRIYAAIAAVTDEVAKAGIGKDRTNAQQGYKFRGIDDVMNTFGPILAKHRVLVLPDYSDRQVTERVTRSGGALFVVTVAGKFRFVSTEDGSEINSGPFIGEASDSADKATNKAMAVAYKYALFQTFCVPLEGIVGGDPDAETHEIAPRTTGPTDDEIRAAKIAAAERLKSAREQKGISQEDLMAEADRIGCSKKRGEWTLAQFAALTDWCMAGVAPIPDDDKLGDALDDSPKAVAA